MKVNVIKTKSCLVRCGIGEITYAINPYVGCRHACAYCYADFMRRFSGHLADRWGAFVDLKSNVAEVLQKELRSKKGGSVLISTVTDCYQPIEQEAKLTRSVLETFASSSPPKDAYEIEILTKSCLAERDFDLFKKLKVKLGVSINTLEDKYSRIIEPFASSPTERLELLKKSVEEKIKTYAFISPVLPGITDLGALFAVLKGVDYILIEMLNTKASVLAKILPLMRRFFPHELMQWKLLLEDKEAYFRELQTTVEICQRREGILVKGLFKH